jgi:truncated hemoglobin YjbI
VRPDRYRGLTAFASLSMAVSDRVNELLRELVGDGLEDRHFDRIVSHLGETMKELELPETEIGTLMETLEAIRDDVLA